LLVAVEFLDSSMRIEIEANKENVAVKEAGFRIVNDLLFGSADQVVSEPQSQIPSRRRIFMLEGRALAEDGKCAGRYLDGWALKSGLLVSLDEEIVKSTRTRALIRPPLRTHALASSACER
jgi:hypothetical protein